MQTKEVQSYILFVKMRKLHLREIDRKMEPESFFQVYLVFFYKENEVMTKEMC